MEQNSDNAIAFCCDDFRSAVEITFANPVGYMSSWLLYGTDNTTVSVGQPELRYWPIRFCPFCGAALPQIPGVARGAAAGHSAVNDR